MLNRAASSLHDEDDGAGLLGFSWQVDRYPLVRLALLFAVIVCPLVVVGWRVGRLQIEMAGVYAGEFSKLTEQIEEIPCLDGSILTSDGQIAAEDVAGLEVQVHYRWIEEPPDPRWVKSKVVARIPRAERRKPERIEAETDKFLAERAALWQQLADATNVPIAELNQRRAAHQHRVESMKKKVERTRALAAQEPLPPEAPATTWLGMARNLFVEWVAQAPEAKAPEKIVLKEELAYYSVVTDITTGLRAKLKSHPELYPNLRVVDVTHREYPLGGVAPHIVGYRKPLTQEEWAARQARLPQGDPLGYLPGDRIGQTGIELFHERHLRGVRGQRKLWLNSQGEVVEEREIRAARPGQDVELTINLELQRQAEQLLRDAINPPPPSPTNPESEEAAAPTLAPAQSGCIAVMDVRTGEMLVAASWPTFDINVYLNGSAAERQAIEVDRRFPLYPRLHKMTLAPGSVFKALTATAMLQAGRRRATDVFDCQGYLDHPNKRRCLPFVHQGVGHGPVDLSLAMAQSCNVYFFNGAREIGGQRLLDSAGQFGFGQPTGIDLPNESAGNLPVMPCDFLGVAIGQAALTVTPLQIVRMMGAIANGGELLTPRLARRSGSAVVSEERPAESGSTLLLAPQSRSIPELSTQTLAAVRHGLEQVVAHPNGTGKRIRLKEVAIAGKTGTAEARGGQDHAWFAGYVPADRPRYALVVVLERGGSGGKMAGPLVKKLVQAMLKEGVIDQSREVAVGE
ncbi:MAG: Peptidoglycan glycosyltransferase [Planctomycetaceae bacterium]|nr:Peptidoglycan glycosyltransferase [Planctomycetaceae bacterium]